MSAPPPYRTRTSVLFARAAPLAVVLRRGPRTRYHLLTWDLASDTFTHGQWMKGDVRLCDLSPSGTKLIYFAEQFYGHRFPRARHGPYDPLTQQPVRTSPPRPRRRRRVPRYLLPAGTTPGPGRPRLLRDGWTAISTPPYFSALAIWPSFGRWTGGGTFAGERDIVIWETKDGMVPLLNVRLPATLRIRGWTHATRGGLTSAYAPGPAESAEHVRIAEALRAQGLVWVDWISLRSGEDMLFAGDGRIFRLRNWRTHAQSGYLGAAALIDLRDLTFQAVAPPDAAMHW